VATKEECFAHLHPEILPMLQQLKDSGIKIGLISNCFSEEVKAIRESKLFPYFDAPCLSYELGMQKPDFGIFKHCLEMLAVEPDECLYVGDGGSEELETARELGMNPLQAVWYLKEGTFQPVARKAGFIQLENPMEVLDYVDSQENICPCCGQYRFESAKRGSYDICPVCFWEDAPYPYEEPDAICSCNGVSLNLARRNYAEFGACRRDMIPYVKNRESEV
jgi:histidinol phosphatase-like enzyme